MTSNLPQALSDGPEHGVAPRSGSSAPLRLLIEGWRFLPHSYSVVNQYQCLELLGRSDVDLRYREAAPLAQLGEPVRGMIPSDKEHALATMKKPEPGWVPEAVYRIGYPIAVKSHPTAKTFVFANCDRGLVGKGFDNDGKNFAETVEEENIDLIVPSEWGRRGMVRCGVDPSRLHVVPHGVDAFEFCPLPAEVRASARQSFGWNDYFLFLHVSAMTGNKNPSGLIQAFAGVLSRHPEARLVIKGLDAMYRSRDWLDEAVQTLSPAEQAMVVPAIFYNGEAMPTSSVAHLMRIADAYVAPYQSEGFCMPALEAAACGLPLVLTSGGATDDFTTDEFRLGIPSHIRSDESDGSYWLETNTADIEAQMERVISDESFRQSAREKGPGMAMSNYSWSGIVDDLVSLIRSRVRAEVLV